MNSLFVLLWLATTVCFVIALIRPTAFTRITKRTHKRAHLLTFFFILGTAFLVATGATAAPSSTNAASKSPSTHTTPKPQITHKQVSTTKAVPFSTQTVTDATLPQGKTVVKQTGVNGVDTTVYNVTYSNGTETGRTQVSDSVTTQPLAQIVADGTYVAPPAPAPAAPAPSATPSCSPLTNAGNCYEPGEYCRASDHGASGVAGDGERITCADNNGWRWEPL